MIIFETNVEDGKPKEKNKLPEVQIFCMKVFLRQLNMFQALKRTIRK